jgi:hypothetical protein
MIYGRRLVYRGRVAHVVRVDPPDFTKLALCGAGPSAKAKPGNGGWLTTCVDLLPTCPICKSKFLAAGDQATLEEGDEL